MENREQYLAVQKKIRPGDIIAFDGTKPISGLIALFTGSQISHVGTVRQPFIEGKDVTITNSTIEDGKSGPQTSGLLHMLEKEYPDGKAYWLQLDDLVRQSIDWVKFYQFIGQSEGSIHYDKEGLFGFLLRNLPFIGPHLMQSEDPHQMFCDAYCIAIYEACGVLRGINYRKMTPQDLCEMNIYKQCTQIWGKKGRIKRFNTV